MDCSKLNRKLHIKCGYNQEASCGSCLPGFSDEYSGVTMPCKELPDRNISHPTYNESSINTARQIRGQETREINPRLNIGIVVILALGSSVAILVCVIFKKQEMSQRFGSPESVVEIEHGQALLPQSHLETDGPAHGEGTLTSRYQETPPRGELEGFQSSGPGAISPLSVAHSISHTPLTTSPRITYIVCHHFIPSTCSLCKTHSKSYQDSAGVILRRGDRYLAHVAMKICHDPTVLYNELDIPTCMLYQNAADHKAKENCPFAEHVLNNLNGWVGVKGQPCLESLLDALCKSGFHHISLDLLNMCDVRATDQL